MTQRSVLTTQRGTCVTQRSVLTTQSKLTVQAPGFGERGSSYAGKYSFRDRGFGDTLHWRLSCQMSHPWLTGGSAHPLAMDGRVSLKPRMARRDLVHCPVFGVGRLNGSLLGCLRKDVALCHTASRAWVGERRFGRTAHFMCTVCLQVDAIVQSGTVLDCMGCPVFGVGRLNGSLLSCLRKDVALCHTASRTWVGERRFGRTAHFMCAVCLQVGAIVQSGTVLACIYDSPAESLK